MACHYRYEDVKMRQKEKKTGCQSVAQQRLCLGSLLTCQPSLEML